MFFGITRNFSLGILENFMNFTTGTYSFKLSGKMENKRRMEIRMMEFGDESA